MKKNWEKEALCRGKDNEIFFPDEAQQMTAKKIKNAKAICTGCPVRAECLFTSITNEEKFGIWGGFSPRERSVIRRAFKKDFTFIVAKELILNDKLQVENYQRNYIGS